MFISPPSGEVSPKEQFPRPAVYLRKLLFALLIIAACLAARYVNLWWKDKNSIPVEKTNVEAVEPQ